MGFLSPDTPKVTPPPPIPPPAAPAPTANISTTSQEARARALRKMGGTLLTGPQGLSQGTTSSGKTLLGA